MLGQFGPADHPPRVHHEVVQKSVLQRSQAHRLARQGDAGRAGIEDQVAAGQAGRRPARRPPQERPEPGQQFSGIEGLGQVVITAGVEALDLLGPPVPGGEDEDRG